MTIYIPYSYNYLFWHAQCLCTAVPKVLALILYVREKNDPLPLLQFPSHISMHTHVVLFCTKGVHKKWCSYIEGDLFWQHSTVVGKPLFCVKQNAQNETHAQTQTCREYLRWVTLDSVANRKLFSVGTENEHVRVKNNKKGNEAESKRGSEPKLMNKQSQRMVHLLKIVAMCHLLLIISI